MKLLVHFLLKCWQPTSSEVDVYFLCVTCYWFKNPKSFHRLAILYIGKLGKEFICQSWLRAYWKKQQFILLLLCVVLVNGINWMSLNRRYLTLNITFNFNMTVIKSLGFCVRNWLNHQIFPCFDKIIVKVVVQIEVFRIDLCRRYIAILFQ